MILATHIMGLTTRESGALTAQSLAAERQTALLAQIAARYATICAGGWLLSRNVQPDRGGTPRHDRAPGRSFDFDDFAGDGGFVFLETPSRYYPERRLPAAACYGGQFDAEALVRAGALVCAGDLGAEYGDRIYQACAEVAATLPRLEPVSDAEMADFMALLGEDSPDVRAYVRAASRDPTDALHDAVYGREPTDPVPPEAVAQARTLAMARVRQLQQQRRLHGDAALALLRQGGHCEILVPARLALAQAVAWIEAGRQQ